jgi:hypothetical protein
VLEVWRQPLLSHLAQAARKYSWSKAPRRSRRSTRPVAALHPPGRERDHVGRLAGSALPQPLVRLGVLVVLDELAQHPLRSTTFSSLGEGTL